jgi:hypothetical protein
MKEDQVALDLAEAKSEIGRLKTRLGIEPAEGEEEESDPSDPAWMKEGQVAEPDSKVMV